MPRIDPFQLLKCLSVLLGPEGGILSQDEVPRLVNLMTKFSKKLVSKCVYILILKSTEQSLVNLFMAEGGWNLIHNWLQDAIHVSNWDLVKEILSLLLVTPVDVERLKLNNIPKLVKSLSKLDEVKGVQELSTQLVHDWLVIVKGNNKPEETAVTQAVEAVKTENDASGTPLSSDNIDTVDSSQIKPSDDPPDEAISTNTFYKVTVRDGKQVISRTASVDGSHDAPTEAASAEPPEPVEIKKEIKEEKLDDKKSSDKSKSKSRSSSSSKHSSSSRSKSSSSKSSSSKDRHKSSSSKSSSRDKDRDRDRDKTKKDKANGAKVTSKDKTESKEKQAEKDKDTLAKIKPQSIDKLGRIPKKTDDKTKENKEVKKPTMSIEVRKNTEERPKTVKVFNSKRRSTGLEEEAKPPPPRPTKKPPVALPPSIPQKRTSPVKELPTPPEKKFKMEIPERPGAIKLIPPKPKRKSCKYFYLCVFLVYRCQSEGMLHKRLFFFFADCPYREWQSAS
ncbi:hypothetical protein TcasGA2_TC013494 [Tribolium castaneum]|uniref:TFIIS N-terminal domain-containing protein n=1 Tax=Tribolium castaneum TaxID=7070 RepID=A0A139WH51_TRICA|nr:hypothetical protein TcasGA2_TC013494 [Tribolium castaneum]